MVEAVTRGTGEHTADQPRSLPAFVVDTSGLPGEFLEISLLPLEPRTRNSLLRLGITTLASLADPSVTDSPAYDNGTNRLQKEEITEGFTTLCNELLVRQAVFRESGGSVDEPLLINAISWYDEHKQAWAGSLKTPDMLALEEIIIQRDLAKNLGRFILDYYKKFGQTALAAELSELSDGVVHVSAVQAGRFLREYGIPDRPREQAFAQAAVKQFGPRPSIVEADLPPVESLARRAQPHKPHKLHLMQQIVDPAEHEGMLEDVSVEDRYIVRAVRQGISYEAIAKALSCSVARVSDRFERTVIYLGHALVRRRGQS